MDYQKKIEYAKRIAEQLDGQKTSEALKAELKAEGLYEPDIVKVMITARNMLGEKYQPKINEFLRAGKPIKGAEEFGAIDDDILSKLIEIEFQNIAAVERKKLTKLIREGQTPEQALKQVDTRFLDPQKAIQQIVSVQQTKSQNSGGGRMLNIAGGIGLIVLTGVILLSTGRLFYFLPVIGLIMIIKGFITQRAAFED